MQKNNLSQKISSGSVQWNYKSVGKGNTDNKLSRLRQEQVQCFTMNEEVEHFNHQHERNQEEKSYQLDETQNFNRQKERSNLNKQLHIQKLSSTERQKTQGEFVPGGAKNLEQIKNQQKEVMSSIMENIESPTNQRNSFSSTNLSTLQDIDVSKTSNKDKIFCQWKQENKSTIYQNSFSSLGTISEENTQKSQSSQYLISSDRNFTNSSLNLNENEDKTEKDNCDEKDSKQSEQAMLLISCLVILTISYFYFIIVT